MGRKAKELQTPAKSNFDSSKLDEAGQAAQELALIERQAADNVKALAVDLGYDGPLDADSLQREVIDTGAALARATFYYGAALLLLREATLHGDWEERLAKMPFSRRAAYNYMTIAAKFKDKKTRDALANMGTLKLLEFASLDDGEIEAFAKGESVRGITLSEAEKMTHKELRQKLDDLKEDKKTTEALLGERNQKIVALEKQLRHLQKLSPDAKLIDLTKEATSLATETAGMVLGNLRQGLIKLRDHAAEHGGDVGVTMAGMVGQIQRELTRLRTEFDLPDVSDAAAMKLAEETAEWAFPKSHDKA